MASSFRYYPQQRQQRWKVFVISMIIGVLTEHGRNINLFLLVESTTTSNIAERRETTKYRTTRKMRTTSTTTPAIVTTNPDVLITNTYQTTTTTSADDLVNSIIDDESQHDEVFASPGTLSTTTIDTTSSSHFVPPVGAVVEEKCKVMDACRLCTSSDYDEIPECTITGKYETLKCYSYYANEIIEDSYMIKFASCKRTKVDEEFAIVRLQVICLILGSFAFANVRRMKVQNASLFDRRKLNAATAAATAANSANNNSVTTAGGALNGGTMTGSLSSGVGDDCHQQGTGNTQSASGSASIEMGNICAEERAQLLGSAERTLHVV